MNENIYNEEYMRVVDEKAIYKERLETIVRYVEGTNYIDKKTILLIAGAEEEKND